MSEAITKQDLNDLGATIARGVSEGMQANLPRQKTFGQYRRDAKSPAHPNGLANIPPFSRPTHQNGVLLFEEGGGITDDLIRKLNSIVRPGRYLDRRVEVVIDTSSAEGGIDIRYSNRTPDQRFDNKNYWTSFVDLVNKIVAEQDEALSEEAENKAQGAALSQLAQEKRAKEVAEKKERPAPSFGKSKAFKQALADAEARARE